jgi:dTDP-4-amino-4,6-dideoxygalactose transaminase
MEIATHHRLVVIEDAAQAIGAHIDGQMVGSFGTGCFSFYPTKNVTSAEGGMLTTNDDDVAERARLLRNHGQTVRYRHEVLGYNLRLTDVHAAIGLAQMDRLRDFTRRRQANAAALNAGLADVVTVPRTRQGYEHVYHQYTVRIGGGARDAVAARLTEQGIGNAIHYPIPVHHQPLYRALGYNTSLPEAERAAREVLCLPVHPALREEDLRRIAEEVRAACFALA